MMTRTCSAEGCDRPVKARGWCSPHWHRWQRYGDPLHVPPRRARAICSIPDCGRPVLARGWCEKHYDRWRAHGDPLVVTVIRGDDHARFWSKVDLAGAGPFGCWQWTGRQVRGGYGSFSVLREAGGGEHRAVMAHRYAYELLVGPIPDGLELDHLCRNTRCVRPTHLEPVTGRVNQRRGIGFPGVNARKTRCVNGHRFDEENTYRTPNGGRHCRTCHREIVRRHRTRKRQEVA